ncbi:MAG: hypothetical protein NC102_02900 [Clostridium sp.]|nr:hypothetical protein [Clostridium sp.]
MRIFSSSVVYLFLALAAVASGSAFAQSPKVIAHRGYWQADGSAQNSIRSLVKADSVGCYASEFDVWLTADSVLVVNHDPAINGHVIEFSDSKTILAQKLANGENVSTLDEYLQAAVPLSTRLVLELKKHDSSAAEALAVKESLRLVEKYGLDSRTDYITFSPQAFWGYIKGAKKDSEVYYLNGDFIPAQIKHMRGAGIDYSLRTMQNHPEWFRQAHDLGLKVNVWTVNAPEDMRWCIENGADFITTNDPELLQKIISEYAEK